MLIIFYTYLHEKSIYQNKMIWQIILYIDRTYYLLE